ncbi:hypothetical protein Q3C01_23790 [Bradyrhizobium sp. UFLA05-109]
MATPISSSAQELPRTGAQDMFSHETDSIDRGHQQRPMGRLSNFVVDELPHSIVEIKCSERPDEAVRALGRSVGAIMAASDYDTLLRRLPQSDFEVAKTDIQYLTNCAYHVSAMAGLHRADAELTIGEPLSQLARLTRERQPGIEVLSYDDMILTNPVQNDPRVYCLGAAGVEERDFCLGHQLIESELQSAIDALLKLRDVADADARQCLALCVDRLEAANQILVRFYEQMSPDLFGQFRVFYGKNPYKDTLGPSGRFSARIVAVSVLLIGEELFLQKPQFYRDVYRLSLYYPQAYIHEVFRWLVPDKASALLKPAWLEGKEEFPRSATISPVIEQGNGDIQKLRASCVRALDRFTLMHHTTALKYTVEPGRPVVGVEASESIDAVLLQRLLTTARQST